jgi:hypothetical protein
MSHTIGTHNVRAFRELFLKISDGGRIPLRNGINNEFFECCQKRGELEEAKLSVIKKLHKSLIRG